MKKRMAIMIIALGIVFGGLFAFNLYRSHMMAEYFKHFSSPPVTISTVTGKKQSWYPMIESVGSFLAINGVDVSAQLAGNVTKIYFKSGQFVEKDTPLIDIDDRIEVAQLKEAKATLLLSRINNRRQVDLLKTQSTSTSNRDQAQANLSIAQAKVEKIKAEINQKHIQAPFSGRLGVRLINLGEYITPGTTKIVTLQSQDPMYLEFNLPEHNIDKLYVDQPIRFTVDAYKHFLFEGKITAINSKVDTNTHNVLVQATLSNCPLEGLLKKDEQQITITPDPLSYFTLTHCSSEKNRKNHIKDFAFVPGMFANIEVVLPTEQNVIVLPRTAVAYSLYGDAVYLVKDKKDKKTGKAVKKVYKQFITTGEDRGNYVLIKKGVKEGDLVVNSGQLKLFDGTSVIINNAIKQPDVPDPDALGQ